jgi:nucleotide-binding universal stress UspA family protein
MNRIVIATDGSAPAKEAVEVGLELAVEHGADVTFVHVLRREEWYRRWSWMSRIWNGTQSERSKRVLGEAAAAAEEVGVSYRLQHMPGDTVDEIILWPTRRTPASSSSACAGAAPSPRPCSAASRTI